MTIPIVNINQIDNAAKTFLNSLPAQVSVIAFYGNMGAGKTTFIKAICEQLGVRDVVNSPTFAIVNEYNDRNGDSIYHFDFYRLNKLEEAIDIGCEDYFQSGSLCLIEWPELVESLLPENTLRVDITVNNDGEREITFK